MSRPAAREAMLTAPSCESTHCVVCGFPRENRHHPCHDGQGPTVAVCGQGNTSGCHRLAHGLGLDFRYSEKHGWTFWASDDATNEINKRRKRTRLPRIKAGEHPCIIAPDFDAVDEPAACEVAPEVEGDVFAAAERQIREATEIEGRGAWVQGAALASVYDALRAVMKPHDASERFRAFYEPLGFSASLASKRMTLARYLPPEHADLGPAKGYVVASAVKAGRGVEEMVALAQTLSCADLAAEAGGGGAREAKPLCCPNCGHSGPREEFRCTTG